MKSNIHLRLFAPALRVLAFVYAVTVCAGVFFTGGCSTPESTAPQPRLPAIPPNTATQAAPRDAA
jgi:hypothetical protein